MLDSPSIARPDPVGAAGARTALPDLQTTVALAVLEQYLDPRRRGQIVRKLRDCLRHTFASMLIEAGEPLTYVQQQLGHHSAAFTLAVYGTCCPGATEGPWTV